MYNNCKYTVQGKFKCGLKKKIEKYRIHTAGCPAVQENHTYWWGIGPDTKCGSGKHGWAATSTHCINACCTEQRVHCYYNCAWNLNPSECRKTCKRERGC